MNNIYSKTYWAPIQTFLVLIFYIILGTFAFLYLLSSTQSINTFLLYLIIIILLVQNIIRFSYRIKLENGKLHELGFFTLKRIISIDMITNIKYKKENFWTGGYSLGGLGDANWQRHFYIESPEAILPKYAIDRSLLIDLLKMRPDLVSKKGV